ncbi:hypothetical protein UFOVP4_24 [uncultured Caudovirales phage]|uniref:Uncharacterized protein n=1 Tax=uncultured Caudovirales phage TaxID=2100421 RepID=A0A6J5TCJ7_9CAUD|nr:hypothetical protein UFOVP4_24 [uncultured Caudovirales phage]CAB4241300.1 hypothetical protein UFOVP64_36 [uncultured Caudovirales phage]CAB5079009.1 hypothetical protein UFOVP145_50 [uncultured Caudovirales phage]
MPTQTNFQNPGFTVDLTSSNLVSDWYEMGQNSGLSVQVTGTFSGTVNFEQSNDTTNAFALLMMNVVNTTVTATSTSTGASVFAGPIYCKYFRVRLSGGTGTARAIVNMTPSSDQLTAGFPTTTTNSTASMGSLSAVNTNVTPLLASKINTTASGVIKASAARYYGCLVLNTSAAIKYLQLYAKATAGIPGTDTPVITIPLAANGVIAENTAIGTFTATGLSWAITTDAVGTTAGTAGDIVGTAYYA